MKRILIIMLCILFPVTVFGKGWGLGFGKDGEVPTGKEDHDFLNLYEAYYVGKEKNLYLTFDAGYENGYTESILDILKSQNVACAFFLTGNYIKTNPHLIRRMVNEGHIVGNHTMTHPNMTTLSDSDFEKELRLLNDEYKAIIGEDIPKYYRPPEGKYNEKNLQLAKQLGYKTIFWSLAYVDWKDEAQPTKQEAFMKLVPRIHDGAVILLHNTSKTNALILEELILKYKDMGYSFKTLEDLTSGMRP